MRLIRIAPDGSLSLVEYIDNKPIPPYGILSHTWLLAKDEVTFEDMTEARGLEKKGYTKITFCAGQAQRDGLKFFWVDTCCIDKSQGPELSEAITSMYRWYQKATKCYVYLRDVRCDTQSRSRVDEAIRRSRWFKRGWTLQELLAPPVVEFYNEKGDFLGDRPSLSTLIAKCTNIPQSALIGTTLSGYGVEQRLSWMKGRRTTKPEDKVYALLGIFGVVLIPIYGEGYENAFARLGRKIQKAARVSEENSLRLRSTENSLQLLQTQNYKKSPNLGFPGCGSRDERVRIDDGLSAPYFIPLTWCETPEDFYDFLKFKFTTERLPGLLQVERGHILTWDRNETRELGFDSWRFSVMHEKELKVSFVMGTWTAPPRDRCMRCLKPRSTGINDMIINECKSCHLAVRWVEPDYLPYEPEDLSLILDKDMYRNYRSRAKVSSIKAQKIRLDAPKCESSDETSTFDKPPVELVCRRMTMKFEPIFNIVFRYLYCRCIIWRATPSCINPEMTSLRDAECPRHNTTGNTFRNYGDYFVPCDQDPYFEQFGGYNVFWALLHDRFPRIFEKLGGLSAISEHELVQAYIAYLQNEQERPGWIQDLTEDYWFELAETCEPLPSEVQGEYLRVKTRRVERGIDRAHSREKLDDNQIKHYRKNFSESAMGRELCEIESGRWTREPHWKLGE